MHGATLVENHLSLGSELSADCYPQVPADAPANNGMGHCSTILSTIFGNLYQLTCDIPCKSSGRVTTPSPFGNIYVSCSENTYVTAVTRVTGGGSSTNYATIPSGSWKAVCTRKGCVWLGI